MKPGKIFNLVGMLVLSCVILFISLGDSFALTSAYRLRNDGTAVHSQYASINALVAAIGSRQETLVVPESETLTASLTIPSTLTLKIPYGGLIVKASTYTLTVNGPRDWGSYQVFSGFSGSDVSGLTLNEVQPEWFGAKADGLDASATTNTSAFGVAEACASNGVVAYGLKKNLRLSAGVYKVTSTPGTYAITVHCPIIGEGPYVSIIENIGTGSALSIKGVTGEIHDSHFSGFHVKGNALSEDGGVLNEGYDVNKAVGYTNFDNVYSTHHGRHGWVHRASWATKYNGCKFDYNGGLGFYAQAAAGVGVSYHNNIILTNCDSRWNGGLGDATGNFLKGGVRVSGNGHGFFWNGGIIESNNPWGWVIGHDTLSINSYINGIKIQNIAMEDTPPSSSATTIGGLFHVDEIYGNVEVNNSQLGYVAPAGGTGYAFYINHVPEQGTSFKEWSNHVESSGSGTATRDYGLTYDWTKPMVTNVLKAGDWAILLANATGQWAVKGFIHCKKNSDNVGGIYPFVAGRDAAASAGALQVSVGASIVGAATTPPTMAWVDNSLVVTIAADHYGHVEMSLGTSNNPPTTFELPADTRRDWLINANFDLGDSTWLKDAGWTIADQGGGDYEGVATNAGENTRIYQSVPAFVVGRTYRLDITCSNFTDGSVAAYAYDGTMGEKLGASLTGTGTSSVYFVPRDTTVLVGAIAKTAGSDLRVDSISLSKVSVWPNDLVKRSNP